MKKFLNIIGAVFLAFVDGKKVAIALNETEEVGTSQSNNDIKNTTFTLYPSHI